MTLETRDPIGMSVLRLVEQLGQVTVGAPTAFDEITALAQVMLDAAVPGLWVRYPGVESSLHLFTALHWASSPGRAERIVAIEQLVADEPGAMVMVAGAIAIGTLIWTHRNCVPGQRRKMVRAMEQEFAALARDGVQYLRLATQ